MTTTAELLSTNRESISTRFREPDSSEQIAWVHKMRAQFSPPGMIASDGGINQIFFRPEKIVVLDDKKWGTDERELLYKGLEVYGVGKWREISNELLPRWDDQALRIKAARLIGSQSLARYVGWKGSRTAVEEEFRKNRLVGERTGCWKGGVLVEDDSGSVKRALEQLQS